MLTPPPATRAKTPLALALQVLALLGVLYVFFVSLELMGGAFQLMGSGFARALLATTSDPLIGLFTGLLATSLVQSSSVTTSLTVALVASGTLSVENAIPLVMGANIGTTVTNLIVSMGHITRPDEFRRAMAGASVHDFFNWLTVLILLPLEIFFGVLSVPARAFTDAMAGVGGTELLSPLKLVTKPVSEALVGLLGANGIVVLLVGLALLFLALRYLVVLLKALVLGRAEGFLHRYVFGRPLVSMLAGLLLTFFVQSSSVTTSLIVPLVGAGILTVRQIFPYTLGANVGTTITALLAALALAAGTAGEAAVAAQAGLAIAFVHVMFNVFGILIIYPFPPIREVPIRIAEFVGNLAYRNRLYAVLFLVGLFYVLPLAVELVRALVAG
ncbi:MAG TPA: Na/Pi symporter [Rubricoccaceae bacterium]|nr:Na/Pi symporter [Rubricoccaceae bacterium]